jgi:hypothetical protein
MNTPKDQFPTTQQLDEALGAGGLPVDEMCRTIIGDGLIQIKRCAWWDAKPEPDLARAFADIAEAGENFARTAESDAGRQAISILEEEGNWYYPIKFSKYHEEFNLLIGAARFYSQVYPPIIPQKFRRTHRENLILYEIYRLYRRLKTASGGRLGIAGPLYRFAKACADLLGVDLLLSERTFRMRIQRIVDKRREQIGSLGDIL